LTPDWHTSDYPELRPGPPWVMEEMIRAQAALPDRLVGLEAAHAINHAAARALAAGDEVIVVGCGTSEHAAMAIAALLEDELATSPRDVRRIRSQQALDAVLDPPSSGLVIGVSHDGGTRATRLALDHARRAGAVTAAITARPDSDFARAADHTLTTPIHDQSWCHTVAYTSAILAGAAIAYADSGTAWSAAATATVNAALADDAARTAGQGLYPAQRVVTIGMGTDLISARELALKIEEGATIAATAHHLETVLHGHLAACEPESTRAVFFASDRRLGEPYLQRLALATRATAEIGLPTTVIGRRDSLPLLPTTVEGIELVTSNDSHDLLAGLLTTAVALQWTALGLIDVAGTNPDLIRREQAPWRTAAAIADEGQAW
jgi:glucosamine--fructose-6-phosphate aminotransferase (isomerizing)